MIRQASIDSLADKASAGGVERVYSWRAKAERDYKRRLGGPPPQWPM